MSILISSSKRIVPKSFTVRLVRSTSRDHRIKLYLVLENKIFYLPTKYFIQVEGILGIWIPRNRESWYQTSKVVAWYRHFAASRQRATRIPRNTEVKFTFLPLSRGKFKFFARVTAMAQLVCATMEQRAWDGDGVEQWFHGDFIKDLPSLWHLLVSSSTALVIYVVHIVHRVRQESGTKFTFNSTNVLLPSVPSYLSCRLVNEPWRTVSETSRLVAPRGGT